MAVQTVFINTNAMVCTLHQVRYLSFFYSNCNIDKPPCGRELHFGIAKTCHQNGEAVRRANDTIQVMMKDFVHHHHLKLSDPSLDACLRSSSRADNPIDDSWSSLPQALYPADPPKHSLTMPDPISRQLRPTSGGVWLPAFMMAFNVLGNFWPKLT